ncbi:type 1 glutamine amidotransferase domain-containing protein [Bdellovibrio bacteriovorus]|uniref:type 1 glutamine amidotransferase domain-containing protein n=1 Tax=Bdellovibrio TaxID=958 RepID=UPI0035A99DD4
MKQALIVVTSNNKLGDTGKSTGWYLSEVTHVYYPLIEAGYTVDFASPLGGAAPLDESSRDLKDPDNKKFLEDKGLMEKMQKTLPLAKVDTKKYHIVHFAGGHGVMWDFHNSADLNRVAAEIYEKGGIVAAVCHGPAALVNVKLSNGQYLVAGKNVSGFTNAEEEQVGYSKIVPFLLESKLKERGAQFQGGQNWESKVSVAERLITGQNPQSAAAVGKKIVEVAKSLK